MANACSVSGEPPFRERTIAELDAACALKDWNTSHFLDTAEMALAVAIGYDWLYDTLSPEQRKRYEDALIKNALKPAQEVYQKERWWSKPGNNWSQVCGTGIALAAAAIAERDPALCNDLFDRGVKLIDGCTRFYQPDGAYPEGPAYWHYGSNYHIIMLAACKPLGDEPKVPDVLRRSGDFIMHLTGPMTVPFNFADSNSSRTTPTAAQSWIAHRFHDTTQARGLRTTLAAIHKEKGKINGGRFFPFHLLWLPPAPPADADQTPLADRFNGPQPTACFRTSWQPDAAYLAIKGGSAAVSHGQMDVGAFIYDAAGIRWFHDLGADNYNLPSYFGSKRWTYYRLTNRSHNTLVIGDQLQKVTKTPARLTEATRVGDQSIATFDLTPAYADQAAQVIRKAGFDHSTGRVTIDDHLVQPVGDVRWAVFTKAKVTIDGQKATLEEKGKRLVIHRHSPPGCSWKLTDAKPPTERENQNKGASCLSFTVPKISGLHLQVSWWLEE